jgi:hypothetical protein
LCHEQKATDWQLLPMCTSRSLQMSKTVAIASLFRVPTRFLRSVQLERDFHDKAALDHYIVTPPMAEAFRRIVDGLRSGSGRRAWRVTGDYGVGKSSFALVLAHLLSTGAQKSASRIAGEIGWDSKGAKLWPVLLTGSRDGIVTSLSGGIAAALRQRISDKRGNSTLNRLARRAESIQESGDPTALESLIEEVRNEAAKSGSGILLIVDELGKILEHASQRPDSEDVFLLQRLAEGAARSGDRPFLLIGLLHQGFHAYAERLPSTAKHEWEKVAGRFDEVVFDQPLAHTAALVAGALNIDARRLPTTVRDAAADAAKATSATGWLGGATTGAATLDAARLYPLHPTLLPVLVRFFARFGQHERSLFGFLLSSEPFGLQSFASQPIGRDNWYRLADFYDYVRAAFGHRLAGGSYRSQWIRIVETIDSAPSLNGLAETVLKTVAVLNLLDAEDLLASDRAIEAAFSPMDRKSVAAAVRQLLDRGLLFRRGGGAGLRLWPQSSVNLDAAFITAARAIGTLDSVAAAIGPYISRDSLMARRHYVERGTLRYFEVRLCPAAAMLDSVTEPSNGDGIVLVALCDTEADRRAALDAAGKSPFDRRADVLVSVSQPLLGLLPELQDARCWDWIALNHPELAADAFTATEVARQKMNAQRLLNARLVGVLGLRNSSTTEVSWFRQGKPVRPAARGGISTELSDICDQLYPKAPLIANELINRNTLSSAASAARMRLIEGLFNAGDRPLLGIDADKAPPEKSMYLSVLAKGRVHVQEGGTYQIVEPSATRDTLRLRPSLERLIERLESARGDRVPAAELLESLRHPPYGVRAGVSPLLLAILLRTRAHELAVYEHGTFLHRFGPSDFLRLTKNPAVFEIQHCQVKGVRVEVFELLASTFAGDVANRQPDLLDVVRPLCQFAAQLPEFTRRAVLGGHALAVRDCLLVAREPVTLLFRDLPDACGVAAFSPEERPDHERVRTFVSRLHDAVGELRGAYPQLLARIVDRLASAVGASRESFDRGKLAARAARVSLAAREPRLRAFALRLRDPGLSDEAWVEALASLVVSKPPSRWASGDEARFSDEISNLAELFYKVEATAFGSESDTPTVDAIRVNLTRGDGEDLVRVVEPTRNSDSNLTLVAEAFAGLLPQERQARLDVLTKLLWSELMTANIEIRSQSSSDAERNRKS